MILCLVHGRALVPFIAGGGRSYPNLWKSVQQAEDTTHVTKLPPHAPPADASLEEQLSKRRCVGAASSGCENWKDGHTFCMRVSVGGHILKTLLDSGATGCFMAARVASLGFARASCPALHVAMADGHSVASTEQVTANMDLAKGHVPICAYVLPALMGDLDLIVGNDWLLQHAAMLDYATQAVTVLHAGVRQRLPVLPHPAQSLSTTNFVAACVATLAHAPPPLLSAKQAVRALKRGARAVWLLLQSDHPPMAGNVSVAATAEQVPDPSKDMRDACAQLPNPVTAVLSKHAGLFGPRPPGLPKDHAVSHTIQLEPGARAPYLPTYRLSPVEQAKAHKQVTDLLAKGLIVPSQSPFGAPILFVQKKDGALRMCVDYRQLNKVTVKDRFPLPRTDDLFDKLQGCCVFSTLDADSAFWQVRIFEADVPKTAFRVPNMGHYEWRVLCFGLTNSPATFQRLMHRCLDGLIGKCCLCYMDDIIIMSKSVALSMLCTWMPCWHAYASLTCTSSSKSACSASPSCISLAMLLAVRASVWTLQKSLLCRAGLSPRTSLSCRVSWALPTSSASLCAATAPWSAR